jgi:hypothetical protein
MDSGASGLTDITCTIDRLLQPVNTGAPCIFIVNDGHAAQRDRRDPNAQIMEIPFSDAVASHIPFVDPVVKPAQGDIVCSQ